MEINPKIAKILDLSKLEHRVLEYLFEARSIQQIASGTGFSRTGIKYALKSMIDKGFVQKIKYGKRSLYVSVTKEELSRKIQDIADELVFSGRGLKGVKLRTSKRDEFIIHVGTEEILPAYSRISSMNKNERIKAIQHHRSWVQLTDKITQEQLEEFNNNIIKNKIILDGMLNESAYKSYAKEIVANPKKHKKGVKSLKGRMADYTVFPDKYFDYDAELWMFKNTALVISWKEEIAIEITNKNITSFLKDMFEFVKMQGRKIDHNKMIEEIIN
jgi:predicted transcriptional regulator